MTRNVGITVICACILSGCVAAPAHADPMPAGREPQRAFPWEAAAAGDRGPAGDPLGYRAFVPPRIPGGVSAYRVYDPPITRGGLLPAVVWNGAPRGFRMPVTALSSWNGTPPPPPGLPPGFDNPNPPGRPPECCSPITPENPVPPNEDYVPGPLPALGVAAAYQWSRRLRRRLGR